VRIFIDTANLNEIRKAKALGLVDGVTTNPTLLAKEGEEMEALIRKISEEVKGPINVEVMGITSEEIVKEAKWMATWGDEIVIKIPITQEGLKAVKILSSEGIRTNVTLLFSANQAILAAKAGANRGPFDCSLSLNLTSKEANLALQQIMNDYAGITVRSETLLKAGLKYLRDLKRKVLTTLTVENSHTLLRSLETMDLIECGEAIFLTASERKETRGLHIRSDFPFTNPLLQDRFLTIRQEKGKVQLEWRDRK